jgi:hypothetical protein
MASPGRHLQHKEPNILVEIKPLKVLTKVAVGHNIYEVEQPYDQCRVYVDGQQVGLTMSNPDDPFFMILHPLSNGYPQEFLDLVVKNSDGQLKGTLRGPAPEPEPEEDDEE